MPVVPPLGAHFVSDAGREDAAGLHQIDDGQHLDLGGRPLSVSVVNIIPGRGLEVSAQQAAYLRDTALATSW